MKYILPTVLLALDLIVWIAILFIGFESIEEIIPVLIVTIILGFEAVAIWRFMGRFTIIKINIGSDAIVYTNYKGDTVIKYEDITKIQFPSIKYTGGWIKIITNQDTIRLTVVVEGIQELLLELKSEIDRRGMNDKYDADKFFKFLKTSAFSDESWQRIYKIWWKLLALDIITLLVGVGIGIYMHFEFLGMFLSIIISTGFPTVLYLITEIIIGRKTAILSNKDTFSIPKSDLEYERRVYKICTLWGTIIYSTIIVAGIAINILS